VLSTSLYKNNIFLSLFIFFYLFLSYMNSLNSTHHINQRKPRKPNNLAQQMKPKRYNHIELKAWNSLYPDVKFKNKPQPKSTKIFDGKVKDDPKSRPPPEKEYDIVKEQKPKTHKKKKNNNPNVFMEKKNLKK